MTTFNKALKELKNGNIDLAWETAKNDDTLNSGITKKQWLKFAYNALANRV